MTDQKSRVPGGAVRGGMRGHFEMRSRADLVELLDSGTLTTSQTEQNLADLARLNRLTGGTGGSVRGIATLLEPATRATVLDVGAGSGDMALAFARAGWPTTALDVNPAVLRVARRVEREGLVDVIEGDARRLPFDADAFDVAHCSLLLHHLDPQVAVQSLRELARVSRRGVVVNDLRRGWFPLAATWASTRLLAHSDVTRVDGLASVRRAYTVAELDELLGQAGLRPAWRSPSWMPRVVTAAVPV